MAQVVGMKWKSTLVLLLLVAGLGAFIWFVERDQASTKIQRDRARSALDVDPDSVSYLEITQSNLVISASLVDHNWRLEQPVQGYADNGEIRRILQGLEALEKGDVISESQRDRSGLTKNDYGLAIPRARIDLRHRGRPTSILVGDHTPLGPSLYVMQTNRQEIIATSTNILSYLPRDVEQLRSRSLLHGVPLRAQRFEIKRSSGLLQITRRDDGQWILQQPIEGRADNSFVRDLVQKFQTARIELFVEDGVEDFGPFGLDKPAVAEVYIWPEGEAGARSVFLGHPVKEDPELVYARVDDWTSVFGVSRKLIEDAQSSAQILRDRRLFNLRTAAVGYIEISSGEETTELQKDDAGSWTLTKPLQRNADDELVWTLLSEWGKARVNSFVPVAAPDETVKPASDAAFTLVLATRPPSQDPEDPPMADADRSRVTFSVQTNPADPGTFLIHNLREPDAVVVDRPLIDRWSIDPLDYYDRLALHLVPEDIRSIELTRGEQREAVEIDDAGEFRAVDDSGRVDEIAVTNILNAVIRLRVDRYVQEDPSDIATYGLAEPSAILTLGLTGEAGISKSILFGRDAEPEGIYAMIRGQSTVFVLPKAVRESVLGRNLVEPEPEVDNSAEPEAQPDAESIP
jgi:hypothetical protein